MVKRLAPEGKLDIAAVGALHADLLALAGQDIEIDCSRITQFGALCLQTCLAAAQAAKKAGTSFRVINLSDALLEQLGHMGFSPESLSKGAL